MNTTLRPSPTFACERRIFTAEGEATGVCALPAGHIGDHEYVDEMGLCRMRLDCRAMSETWATLLDGPRRNNGFAHNHA